MGRTAFYNALVGGEQVERWVFLCAPIGVRMISLALLHPCEASAAEMASLAPNSAIQSISEVNMEQGYSVALSGHEHMPDTQ